MFFYTISREFIILGFVGNEYNEISGLDGDIPVKRLVLDRAGLFNYKVTIMLNLC